MDVTMGDQYKNNSNIPSGMVERDGITGITLRGQTVKLPSTYNPLTDSDPYQNILFFAFFKKKLLMWKLECQVVIDETLEELSTYDIGNKSAEEEDRATDEASILTRLRTRDRLRKLCNKIDDAIARIETGDFGYCEMSGEEIGVRRLLARPIAIYTIEMQRIHEKEEDIMEDAERSHRLLELDENITGDDDLQ